jgi:uncharacterized cupin superfamily protein
VLVNGPGYAARSLDELPDLWDGFARLVREGMGITAFGVQVMNLPPDYATKSHDESHSGQEELYLALRGSGAVIVHGDPDERLPLEPERVVGVGPGVERTLASGAEGMRVLCVGGAPGKPYEAPDWTEG